MKLAIIIAFLVMTTGCASTPGHFGSTACYWGSVHPIGARYCNDPGE